MKVKLLPFDNQVTGHDCLLTTEDKSAVCKVQHLKELQFYLNMDRSLQPFAPKFQGSVDVTVLHDEEQGYCRFEAHFDGTGFGVSTITSPVVRQGESENNRRENCDLQHVKYRSPDPRRYTSEPGFRSNEYTRDIKFSLSKRLSDVGKNPWVDRVHRIGRHIGYIGKTIPYIVLENIAGGFEMPCILDLKMGTQIYDHDCPREKRKKHIAKNEVTTTRTMGMRLCGLQVYEGGSYQCLDKYYGRGLSDDGLVDNIKLFFSSAGEYRSEIMQHSVDIIFNIREVVSKLDGYRFNGSSVILVYEGCDRMEIDDCRRTKVDVRIVDFAHSSRFSKEEAEGPDVGFLFGLDNLMKAIIDLQ